MVYYGDTAADVIVHSDKDTDSSPLHIYRTIEKGDILEVDGLADNKKNKKTVWEIYETGTDHKLGESLFYLDCKDKEMNGPEDCGAPSGDGKKKDKKQPYINSWLFNGLSDSKGHSFRCDLPETHAIAPKITLLGADPISLEIGDDFIDPGAEAYDNLDGNLTSSIISETDLDVLAVGAYTVTYTVIDSDGNLGTALRSVTVSDENVKVRTLQNRVSSSSDDAEENPSGIVYLTSSDLELVIDNTSTLNTDIVGIRFSNVGIPENAVITKAYIQFKVDEISSENTDLTIYGEKSNYTPTFNTSAFNITARQKTDASAVWAPLPWNNIGDAAGDQRTPDLTSIVQEIVSGDGWRYANAMAFIFTGDGKRVAKAYDGDPEGAPKLFVEYRSGTAIHTVTISPQIRRMLPVNSSDYYLKNVPTKGTVEINSATGEFVYISHAGATGRDILKFKTNDGVPNSDTLIIKVVLTPAPVRLNGVEQPDFSSNLPLLILDTNNRAIPDDPKIKGVLTIIPAGESGRSSLRKIPEYSDYMEIELRGSSSLNFAKKGYGVDTLTVDDEDNDAPLLGMPEEHKWVLHGPYSDKSLMRNYIAYNKTRDMGGYGAVRTKYVEVLMQEGDGYRYDGVYVFMEKIKRDKNRVDIEKLKSSDTTEPEITGGYIMKKDRPKDDWYFRTIVKGSQIVMEYPKTKNLNDEQKSYIQSFMNSFESALFASDFNDSTSANYYENFIEPDSFAKHLLSRELFRDVDTWYLSEFFHKEREGKLSMLPVWDFNLGMGNANYGYNGSTVGWHYNGRSNGPGGWMNRLMKDSKFRNSVGQKWFALRSDIWSDENLNRFIDDTKALLRESQGRNFQRWPVLGIYTWPNRLACDNETAYCDTWDKAVDEHLRTWLLARAAWMDANLPNITSETKKVIITEIHYNPKDDDDGLYEFIELYNDEEREVDLSGWHFTDGIDLVFAAGTKIPAKAILIIAHDSSKYSGSIQWSDGKLSNGGEAIVLQNAGGETVDVVEYADESPWLSTPDGGGPSLELKADKLNTVDNDYAANWQASSVNGGTPGMLP